MPEKGFDILMGRIKTRIINKEIDLAELLDKEEKRALERQEEIDAERADRDALDAWLKKLQRRTKKDDPLVDRYNDLWGLAGFNDRMPGDSALIEKLYKITMEITDDMYADSTVEDYLTRLVAEIEKAIPESEHYQPKK